MNKILLLLVVFESVTMGCTHLKLKEYNKDEQTISISVRKPAYEHEAELAVEEYCKAPGSLIKVEGRVYTYTCGGH